MAAQVLGDDAMRAGERPLQLAQPAQVRLGEAVEEQQVYAALGAGCRLEDLRGDGHAVRCGDPYRTVGRDLEVQISIGSFRRRSSSAFWSSNCGEMMNAWPSVSSGSSTVKPSVCVASNRAPAGVRT